MKKILSLLIGTVAMSTVSFAQNCTVDNSLVNPGVSPSIVQGFEDGFVNTAYEQTAQIKVLLDTVVDLGSGPTAATVSYAIIDSVVGMPAGFLYNCNTPDCKILGGATGCTVMYGTPSLADVNKKFDLTIYTTLYGIPTAWIGLGLADVAFPVEIPGYSVTIQPEANSVNELNSGILSKVYPNPTSDILNVEITANSSEEAKISIVNILGATVKTENIKLNSGLNTLSFTTSDLNTGIHMVSVEGSFGTVIHKIMVK